MRGLSGAHFIAWGTEGQVTETSLPTLEGLPALASNGASRGCTCDSLAESPSILRGRHAVFRGVGSVTERTAGRFARGALPRDELAAGTAGSGDAVAAARGLARSASMVLVTSWIAHRISGRIRRVQQQVAGSPPATSGSSTPAAGMTRSADLTVSINRMCSQLKGMRQTIQQSERARLLAQLAAGLAHQLRNSLTGARMSVQLARANAIRPRPATRRSRSPCGSSRSPKSRSKGLLSAGRVERQPPEVCDLATAPGGCRTSGRSGMPARQGHSQSAAPERGRLARAAWPTGRAFARRS